MFLRLLTASMLLAGLVGGNIYADPKVSISAKLQGTKEGHVILRRLAALLDKRVEFVHKGTDHTGVIHRIIVPDIADYLRTGDQSKARFRAEVWGQRKDAVATAITFQEELELGDLDIIDKGGIGHVQYIASELLGEDYRRARLLAKYEDNDGEVFWEALVEMTGGGAQAVELDDPFIIMLSEKDDFDKIIAL